MAGRGYSTNNEDWKELLDFDAEMEGFSMFEKILAPAVRCVVAKSSSKILRSMFKGLFLYTGGVLFHVE